MVGDDGGDGRVTLREIFAAARAPYESHEAEERVRPGLSPEEFRLWTLYRWMERPERGGFLGDKKLGRLMGRSERSVQGYRASLLEKGYLRQKLRGPKPAEYRAVLPDEEPDPEDEGGPDAFEPSAWIEAVRDADSPLASKHLPAGVRPLLWRGEEPPDGAPDGWGFRAEIGHLSRLREERDWTGFEVGLAMIGLHEMGEAGDVPAGVTSAFPARSRTWDGPELWGSALEAGRDWYARTNGRSDRVDELARKAGS